MKSKWLERFRSRPERLPVPVGKPAILEPVWWQPTEPVPEKEEEAPPAILAAVLPTSGGSEGKIDLGSETWIFVNRWATDELRKLRESNDNEKLDASKTAAIRGKIAQVKKIIALPEPAKERNLVDPEREPLRLKGYNIR